MRTRFRITNIHIQRTLLQLRRRGGVRAPQTTLKGTSTNMGGLGAAVPVKTVLT